MNKILILGGTNFIGRVVVEELLLQNKYDITLFNRGKRNADLFPQVKRITGDRETDGYLQIAKQPWDCIIDISGYYPDSFEKLLRSLEGKVKRYIFISTVSVYDIPSFAGKEINEEGAILPCSRPQRTSKLPDAYGEKKAEMERILLRQQWLDKIIIRPSFVYGRYDFTDRFYHWLWRGRTQSRVLFPSPKDNNFSLTEVNQLAQGIICAIDTERHSTVYNAVTFSHCTLKDIVNAGKASADKQIQFARAHKHMLATWNLQESAFPLYAPFPFVVSEAKWKNDFRLNTPERLVTPDALSYYDNLNWYEPKAGLSAQKEAEMLAQF